jgi:hypothetical protein
MLDAWPPDTTALELAVKRTHRRPLPVNAGVPASHVCADVVGIRPQLCAAMPTWFFVDTAVAKTTYSLLLSRSMRSRRLSDQSPSPQTPSLNPHRPVNSWKALVACSKTPTAHTTAGARFAGGPRPQIRQAIEIALDRGRPARNL